MSSRFQPLSPRIGAQVALRPDEIMAFDRFVRTVTEKLEARDAEGRSLFLERTRPDEALERR